ncbi:hypothetical protein QJQ45_010789 [Haematococcus lacustris]|nr:hypothetical protein QJQ45_010789 [Haematococcus lacustris]
MGALEQHEQATSKTPHKLATNLTATHSTATALSQSVSIVEDTAGRPACLLPGGCHFSALEAELTEIERVFMNCSIHRRTKSEDGAKPGRSSPVGRRSPSPEGQSHSAPGGLGSGAPPQAGPISKPTSSTQPADTVQTQLQHLEANAQQIGSVLPAPAGNRRRAQLQELSRMQAQMLTELHQRASHHQADYLAVPVQPLSEPSECVYRSTATSLHDAAVSTASDHAAAELQACHGQVLPAEVKQGAHATSSSELSSLSEASEAAVVAEAPADRAVASHMPNALGTAHLNCTAAAAIPALVPAPWEPAAAPPPLTGELHMLNANNTAKQAERQSSPSSLTRHSFGTASHWVGSLTAAAAAAVGEVGVSKADRAMLHQAAVQLQHRQPTHQQAFQHDAAPQSYLYVPASPSQPLHVQAPSPQHLSLHASKAAFTSMAGGVSGPSPVRPSVASSINRGSPPPPLPRSGAGTSPRRPLSSHPSPATDRTGSPDRRYGRLPARLSTNTMLAPFFSASATTAAATGTTSANLARGRSSTPPSKLQSYKSTSATVHVEATLPASIRSDRLSPHPSLQPQPDYFSPAQAQKGAPASHTTHTFMPASRTHMGPASQARLSSLPNPQTSLHQQALSNHWMDTSLNIRATAKTDATRFPAAPASAVEPAPPSGLLRPEPPALQLHAHAMLHALPLLPAATPASNILPFSPAAVLAAPPDPAASVPPPHYHAITLMGQPGAKPLHAELLLAETRTQFLNVSSPGKPGTGQPAVATRCSCRNNCAVATTSPELGSARPELHSSALLPLEHLRLSRAPQAGAEQLPLQLLLHQLQGKQAQQAAAAVALLLQPGNGLQQRLAQGVTQEEAQELRALHALVAQQKVLAPQEHMALWSRVEALLAASLPPPALASTLPRPPVPLASVAHSQSCPRRPLGGRYPSTQPVAQTEARRPGALPGNSRACPSPTKHSLTITSQAAQAHSQPPSALATWRPSQQPTSSMAGLPQGQASLARAGHYMEPGRGSPASQASGQHSRPSPRRDLFRDISPMRPDSHAAREASTPLSRSESPELQQTMARVHRAVAPNATLAWAMDREWQALRQRQALQAAAAGSVPSTM